MDVLNFNVGLLGHVDSGKTSVAKVLSAVSSTACFDKHPQSQERGITIDLGFSSFSGDLPQHLISERYKTIQYTLVDCPGHASLIKTIIGGSHIIDLMVLVVDVVKGIQTQTAECLIIGEITNKKLIVALNKTDLLKDTSALEKVKKKMKVTLDATVFKGCSIVSVSAVKGDITELTSAIMAESFLPQRDPTQPFLFAIDHCFAIKGKGTVLTGTILQGSVKNNDEIEIPAIKQVKKVKSIQMFKKAVNSATEGDRVGLCVTQFDAKLVERGLASAVGLVSQVAAAVIPFNKVSFYRGVIASKAKFHINVGYENVIAKVLLFSGLSGLSHSDAFELGQNYRYIEEVSEVTASDTGNVFVLLEFEKPVLMVLNSLAIAAKLDTDITANTCRLAFYGHVSHTWFPGKPVSDLRVFKEKERRGVVERLVNDQEIVAKNMFKKETDMSKFVNLTVDLSTGEHGVIDGSFGQSGKFKVSVRGGLMESTITRLKCKSADTKEGPVEVVLRHKKYLLDPSKRLTQQ